MRCMMACEDEPDYVIGGGDMNGIRLSRHHGPAWFHPASKGLRCPGFNSVAIDPRDHNHLLALGNMVWWGTNNAKQQARCGVWRSTDFGETWSFAQRWTTPGPTTSTRASSPTRRPRGRRRAGGPGLVT